MAQTIGEAFVVVRPDTKGFAAEADNNISGALGKTFANVTKLAAAAAVAGGAALAGLGAWGLKSAADMQQVEIAFEGIFQSGEKSKKFLDDLRAFAAKTPFEFPELARSAKMLLATGTAAEDVIPVMTKLGNVAATLGVGGAEIEGVVRALGQMQGKGKASAEELQQISEQIPGFSAIKAIAEEMGITVSEAFAEMAAGAISADTAIAAILKGMDKFPGAAGAMARQAKTLTGVLSTLKDTVRDALVSGLAPILPALAETINDAMGIIGPIVASIGATFGKILTGLVPVMQTLLPIIAKLADGFGSVLVDAMSMLVPIFDMIGPQIEGLIDALVPLIAELVRGLAPVLATLAPAFLRLATSMAQALLPIVRALTPVIADLADIFARVIDTIGPWPFLIGLLVAKLAAMAVSLYSVAGAAVTAELAVSAIAPAIVAFGAAFIGTTFILEKMFGRSKDLTDQLAALEEQAAALTKVADAQLAPAFDKLVLAWKDTHSNAAGLTITLGAFTEVAEANLGTAIRLAEQYKNDPVVYRAMQQAIARLAGEQQQANADMQAGADAAVVLKGALERIPPLVSSTIAIDTSQAVAALAELSYQYSQMTLFQQQQADAVALVSGFTSYGFASGGRVPGPEGKPVPAIVHGGEVVLNREQQADVASMVGGGGGPSYAFNFNVTSAGDPVDFAYQSAARARVAMYTAGLS